MSVDVEDIIEYLEKGLTSRLNSAVVEDNEFQWIKEAEVDRIGHLKLLINPREHTPPHFHVKTSGIDASFRIDNCEKLVGEISSDDHKKIKNWHSKNNNKDLLVDVWNRMRPSDCPVGEYKE